MKTKDCFFALRRALIKLELNAQIGSPQRQVYQEIGDAIFRIVTVLDSADSIRHTAKLVTAKLVTAPVEFKKPRYRYLKFRELIRPGDEYGYRTEHFEHCKQVKFTIGKRVKKISVGYFRRKI